MKLIRYLNEQEMSLDDIIIILKRDCKPILRVLKNGKWFLWRGRPPKGFEKGFPKLDTKDILEVTPRKDRKPTHTPLVDHIALNKAFNEKFGWNVRSEAVFATRKRTEAYIFGQPYLFFPVGKFEFVYSEKVEDLWRDWSQYRYVEWDKFEGEMLKKNPDYGMEIIAPEFQKKWEAGLVDKVAKKLMKAYKNTGIKKAIDSGNEIAFRVKSYYIVNPDFADGIANAFGVRYP